MLAHLNRFVGRGARIEASLARIEAAVVHLLKGQGVIMGQLEELVSALDAETNAVAAKIDKLHADLAAAIAAGQAPKPETLAALQAVSDRLKVLGQDPAQPIPPAPPTTTPSPAPTP